MCGGTGAGTPRDKTRIPVGRAADYEIPLSFVAVVVVVFEGDLLRTLAIMMNFKCLYISAVVSWCIADAYMHPLSAVVEYITLLTAIWRSDLGFASRFINLITSTVLYLSAWLHSVEFALSEY